MLVLAARCLGGSRCGLRCAAVRLRRGSLVRRGPRRRSLFRLRRRARGVRSGVSSGSGVGFGVDFLLFRRADVSPASACAAELEDFFRRRRGDGVHFLARLQKKLALFLIGQLSSAARSRLTKAGGERLQGQAASGEWERRRRIKMTAASQAGCGCAFRDRGAVCRALGFAPEDGIQFSA